MPSSILEAEFEEDDRDEDNGEREGWDGLLLEDEDGAMTTGMNTEVDSD